MFLQCLSFFTPLIMKEVTVMILYYFSKPNDLTLYKMRIKESSVGKARTGTISVLVEEEDDIRKYKPYAVSFELDAKEGVVRYKRFWLYDEDDERAEKIKNEYLNAQQKKLEKQLNKLINEREQN